MTAYVDMRRLAQAVSAPGIDPSCWLTLGRVDDDDEAFSWVAGTGWVVDVTFHGGKLDQVASIPCRVGASIASSGELSSCPIAKGAEVLVAFPGDGDLNDSPVILAQLPNAGRNPAPAFIFAETTSPEPIDEAFARSTIFLVVESDVKLDVGKVFRLQAVDEAGLHAQVVTLAEKDATQAFVRGTAFATALGAFLDATDVMASALATAFGTAATASTGPLAALATPFGAMQAAILTWKPSIAVLKATLVPGNALSERIRGE